MDLDKDYKTNSLFRNKTVNVVKLLDEMRCGKSPPRRHEREVTMKRASVLEVTRHASVEPYHQSEITAIALEKPQERYLITGSENGDLAIHDVWNFANSHSFTAKINSQYRNAHGSIIKSIQWDPVYNSKVLTCGWDRRVKVWDVNPIKAVLSIPVGHYVNHLSIASQSSVHRLIAVGMRYPGVILLDSNSRTVSHELSGHRMGVSMVEWFPSSEFLLASGGIDGRIFFWDIRSTDEYLLCLDQFNGAHDDFKRMILSTAHNDSIDSIKFTNDGLMLVSHCVDGNIKLWDACSGKSIIRDFGFPIRSRSGKPIVMDICWEGKEPLLFIPCSFHILLYNLATGTRMRTMVGHTGMVTGCVYYSRTCELFSIGKDCNIIKWTVNRTTGLRRISREALVWS